MTIHKSRAMTCIYEVPEEVPIIGLLITIYQIIP
jgi:hypothetical protein